MNGQAIILRVILLVVIDQAIKIIIYSFYLDYTFDIIPSLLEFKPYFNSKHSYVNFLLDKHFQINAGFWPHIILYLLLAVFVFILYATFRTKPNTTHIKVLDTAFIFLIAALACALIGNIIWEKGTLDYIYLKPLFIFDLKDIYSNCFLVIFLIYFHKNKDQMKTLQMMSIKEVFRYFMNRQT